MSIYGALNFMILKHGYICEALVPLVLSGAMILCYLLVVQVHKLLTRAGSARDIQDMRVAVDSSALY